MGKKTAERLIIEMKDRLSEWQDKIENLDDGVNNRESIDSKQKIIKKVKMTLVTLGYRNLEAEKALDKLDLTSIDSSESAIRMALQTMLKV